MEDSSQSDARKTKQDSAGDKKAHRDAARRQLPPTKTKETADPKPQPFRKECPLGTVIGASNTPGLSPLLQKDADACLEVNAECKFQDLEYRASNMVTKDIDITVLHLGIKSSTRSLMPRICYDVTMRWP